MAYDHSTKIGNQGDLVKHVALFAAIQHLLKCFPSDQEFVYADIHAGRPEYVLPDKGEWQYGIRPFSQTQQLVADRLNRMDVGSRLGTIGAFDEIFLNRPVAPGMVYPGSSGIAFRLLSKAMVQFRMLLCEMNDSAADDIESHFQKSQDVVSVVRGDGYEFVNGDSPLSFVLIDPPALETDAVIQTMKALNARNVPFVCWTPRTSRSVKPVKPGDSWSGAESGPSVEYIKKAEECGICLQIQWHAWGHRTPGCCVTVSAQLAEVVRAAVKDVVALMEWEMKDDCRANEFSGPDGGSREPSLEKVMPELSPYRQPKFLGQDHEPVHRVRCAVHGFIRYSDREREVIDHPLFRRLRYIKQLALTELVYPGATHTRFEHSLGVMEMATRIFDRLASGDGAKMESVFREIPVLADDTMARARQVCRLAALLHDLGHCCFSDAAEKVLHKNSGHEELSVHVLTTPELLGSMLDTRFFDGCSKAVASLLKTPVPQLQILADIVSGQIDADRTDYLLRDSYHCGVEYGRFDYRRLIECLTVWQDDPGGPLEMAIQRDGIHSFESLILARYQMNTQVYYHRLRRIYDLYLEKYFASLDPSRFNTPSKILDLNDVRATVELMDASIDSNHPGHEWATRIVNRRHHRDVFGLDEREGSLAVKKIAIVLKRIREEYKDIEFLEDFPEKTVSIHKIAAPSDQRDDRIDFPLIDRGKRYSLGERSQLLEKLPGEFRIGYVFADISDREKKRQIATRCREIYQNA